MILTLNSSEVLFVFHWCVLFFFTWVVGVVLVPCKDLCIGPHKGHHEGGTAPVPRQVGPQGVGVYLQQGVGTCSSKVNVHLDSNLA